LYPERFGGHPSRKGSPVKKEVPDEVAFQNLENQLHQMSQENLLLQQEVSRQSDIIEHLRGDIQDFNLLKILATTGVIRDLKVSEDPRIREALLKLILHQLRIPTGEG